MSHSYFRQVTLGILLFSSMAWSFAVENEASLKKWLNENAGYRLATAVDCNCLDSMKDHKRNDPYRMTGDFDGDGKPDEAVVVVNQKSPKDFLILVFSSRFAHGRSPIVYKNIFGTSLFGLALFKSEFDSTKSVLLFGNFDSEAIPIYLPAQIPK